MQPGFDYVLIGRRTALDLPFERLAEDFDRALARVHGHANGHGHGKSPAVTPHAGAR
jgi:ribonuclease P protein component